MRLTSPGRRVRSGVSVLGISLLAFSAPGHGLRAAAEAETGTVEKLIVSSGAVALDLDLQRLDPAGARAVATKSAPAPASYELERDSFLTILVLDSEFRAALPGSARLFPADASALPSSLSSRDLMVEQTAWGAPFEMVVRDAATGLPVFNVEGQEYAWDAEKRALSIRGGRLLLAKEFAAELGRASEAGSVVGTLTLDAAMRAIEVAHIVDGELREDSMPGAATGGVPGPDVIVGDVNGLAQFGSQAGSQVGLALGTDACNAGQENLHWFALPNNDHPVIPQNMYRMSGGATNDERFEQIGQSNVKHAFTALTQNLCGFGCNGVGGPNLGSGCSDPYSAGLNAGPGLGSRAWINPYSGFYPRGDSPTPPNTHTSHVHLGPSHRILTEVNDLNTSLNVGATYYAEGQYVTPHEYAWCQANPGQCNMDNNVSYKRYNVIGTASPFSFSPVGSTVRMEPAVNAWTGATRRLFRPASDDGIGIVAYKVTNPSAGVWHYEYAIYNQTLDRAIQSLTLPKRPGVVITNVGFHAPPQHPGWTFDGTVGNTGFSSAPWAQSEVGNQITWSSETFAQNPNANAVRWGTLYNIRFDSNRPPVNGPATIGFFKTGAPVTVSVAAPAGTDPTCSRGGPC